MSFGTRPIPPMIPGLALWLDAADASTIQVAPGTSNVTAITDKSGVNTCTPSSLTYDSTVKGFVFVRSSALSTTYSACPLNETFFMVVSVTNPTATNVLVDAPTGNHEIFRDGNIIYYSIRGVGYNATSVALTWSANTRYLFNYQNTPTTVYMYQSGTQIANGGGPFPTGTGATTTIGVTSGNPGLDGKVYECIGYSTFLSNADRQRVEAYLATKWGLPLAAGNPWAILQPKATASFGTRAIPQMIPGLALWLDAADASTVQVTPGTSNVTVWRDKSAAIQFSQAGGGNYPTYTQKTVNNLNSIRFVHANSQFVKNDTFTLNNMAYSIFAVATQNNCANYSYLLKGSSTTDGFLAFGTLNNNFTTFTGPKTGGGTWNDIAANTPNITIGSTPMLLEMTVSNNILIPYYNGTVMDQKVGTTGVFAGIEIGEVRLSGQGWNGYIGEILIYNTALGTVDRQRVEAYLGAKWGIPLAASVPLPPTLAIMGGSLPSVPAIYLLASQYSGSGDWIDLSPNKRNATLETGVAAKNAKGNGIILNGSTGWTFPDVVVNGTWTMSVWYKNTGAFIGGQAAIVSQRWIGNGYINISLTHASNGSTEGFCIHNGTWHNGPTISISYPTWTYYTGTLSGGFLTTYINGISQGTVNTGTTQTAGSKYRIGSTWESALVYFVRGEIGEVRIYPTALTRDQILTDYLQSIHLYV